jgi:hypothetical protein
LPKVLLEMSVSVDGSVTGPDVGPDEPIGRPIEVTAEPKVTHLTYEVERSPAG